jgi:hypothetical protein
MIDVVDEQILGFRKTLNQRPQTLFVARKRLQFYAEQGRDIVADAIFGLGEGAEKSYSP